MADVRAVTARFQSAITRTHRATTRATVISTAGTETVVQVTDGTVTLDQTAAIRGRCDITVTDTGPLIPDSPSSLLAPYGNEIRVERGITYPDGTEELVSLGVFGIEDTDVDDSGSSLTVALSGLDRAQRFVNAGFEEPYNVTAGTLFTTAILTALQAAWPDVPHSFTASALTTPALIAQEGDDRWQFAQDLAEAISMRLYFDGDGVLQLVPDVLASPVMTIAEGDDGVLVQATRQWTRSGAFNRVIMTGENTREDAPVRGVATDDNPLSPTYYFGPFGKAPRFEYSSLITTDAQAAAAAQGILNLEIGTSESVSFGSLVLPHLEPSDTVTITRARAGINEAHVLDSVTVPLSATDSMSGKTRARQVS